MLEVRIDGCVVWEWDPTDATGSIAVHSRPDEGSSTGALN